VRKKNKILKLVGTHHVRRTLAVSFDVTKSEDAARAVSCDL